MPLSIDTYSPQQQFCHMFSATCLTVGQPCCYTEKACQVTTTVVVLFPRGELYEARYTQCFKFVLDIN